MGACVRRLGEPDANDLGAHLRRIHALQPEHEGTLRRLGYRGQYVVHHRDADGSVWLEHTTRDAGFHRFIDHHAGEWYFDGEPQIEVRSGDALPWLPIYQAIASGEALDASNLRYGDSNVVLAGRSTGRSATEDLFSGVRFESAGCGATLGELLTLVAPPGSRSVSRVRYLNPRSAAGREFDREGSPPRIVIADGGDALLRVLDLATCESATVIAHLPRTDDQSRLEEVSAALSGLRQWFDADAHIGEQLPTAPRGVTLAVLRQRAME